MKIGNIEIKNSAALAPMAGVADCAFRELCASYGAAYTVTEMVSSKGIYYNSKKSAELMELTDKERPSGIQRLWLMLQYLQCSLNRTLLI